MAGFGRFSFDGEYHGQVIENIFHFRSTEWLPGEGNPFTDFTAFLDAIASLWVDTWLAAAIKGYKLNTVSGVGYDDAYAIVTPSPLVKTINQFGAGPNDVSNGAASCVIMAWRCGAQVQISGLGHSLRNRGYTAFGPLNDVNVDEESHISGADFDRFAALAAVVQTPVTVLLPAVTLTPIIVHEKWTTVLGHKVLDWRTYSDIQGYAIRRVVSNRRSRRPEA